MIDIFYIYLLQISLFIMNNYLNIILFTFLFQNEVSYDMNLKEKRNGYHPQNMD